MNISKIYKPRFILKQRIIYFNSKIMFSKFCGTFQKLNFVRKKSIFYAINLEMSLKQFCSAQIKFQCQSSEYSWDIYIVDINLNRSKALYVNVIYSNAKLLFQKKHIGSKDGEVPHYGYPEEALHFIRTFAPGNVKGEIRDVR